MEEGNEVGLELIFPIPVYSVIPASLLAPVGYFSAFVKIK